MSTFCNLMCILCLSENPETTTVEVSPEVLQQVQAAFQNELPQLTATVGYTTISKTDDVTHTVIHDHHVQVLNDGIQCTTCTKPGKYYGLYVVKH